MKRIVQRCSFMVCIFMLIFCLIGCSGKNTKLNPDNPVTLAIWHVYGSQTESPFNDSIDAFNRTVGAQKGVIIEVTSVSDSSAIDEDILAALAEVPGSELLPDLFIAYPRIAEKVGYDKLLDFKPYLTKAKLSEYIPTFLEEGYFDDKLLMLPVAKSTELLFLNQTNFDFFTKETGIQKKDMLELTSLFNVCNAYYDWSERKPLFQCNDYYHFFLSNMTSLGSEFIVNEKINTQDSNFEKCYNTLAEATVYGGVFVGEGYASDRWKTGEILSNIGSTAGILYLRDYVTNADGSTKNIRTSILPYPNFLGGESVTVHRGAGLFAVKSDLEAKNQAAAVFAKWIAQSENNLAFVTKAGYLPVTKIGAKDLFENLEIVENEKYQVLYSTLKEMEGTYSYCTILLFEGSADLQRNFEKTMKDGLIIARSTYLNRVSNGEDPQYVMDEVVAELLLQIKEEFK